MEGWILKVGTMISLEAFEMWIYPGMDDRKRMRILHRNSIFRTRVCATKKPFALLIERRGIGRKKMLWLRNIKCWTGIRTTKGEIHITRHRKTWSHQTSMNSSEIRRVIGNIILAGKPRKFSS